MSTLIQAFGTNYLNADHSKTSMSIDKPVQEASRENPVLITKGKLATGQYYDLGPVHNDPWTCGMSEYKGMHVVGVKTDQGIVIHPHLLYCPNPPKMPPRPEPVTKIELPEWLTDSYTANQTPESQTDHHSQ